MAAKHPALGVRHLTVVPTNFDPTGGDEDEDDPDDARP